MVSFRLTYSAKRSASFHMLNRTDGLSGLFICSSVVCVLFFFVPAIPPFLQEGKLKKGLSPENTAPVDHGFMHWQYIRRSCDQHEVEICIGGNIHSDAEAQSYPESNAGTQLCQRLLQTSTGRMLLCVCACGRFFGADRRLCVVTALALLICIHGEFPFNI